jgi:hypothetical protein
MKTPLYLAKLSGKWMRITNATGDGDVPGDVLKNVGMRWLQTNDTNDEQYI